MYERIRRGLTFSNVCSFLALVIALSAGTAYAANTVRSSDIVDGQVKNADLGADAVSTGKIHDGAVTRHDIRANAVRGTKILDGSVGNPDLAAASVRSAQIAASAVGASEVANESLTLSDIAGAATNGAVSLSGIPDGRCTQVIFNVSSAAVGDTAIVSTRAAIQNGIVMYANRVVSAGQVEVNACNFSGTAMTALSNFPVRIITFR